jgi:hypothetical protein
MEDGYTTPVEQMIRNLSLTCPNAPLRKVIRPTFQEPIEGQSQRLALALTATRPTKGGLTLKGYGSPESSKK